MREKIHTILILHNYILSEMLITIKGRVLLHKFMARSSLGQYFNNIKATIIKSGVTYSTQDNDQHSYQKWKYLHQGEIIKFKNSHLLLTTINFRKRPANPLNIKCLTQFFAFEKFSSVWLVFVYIYFVL